MFEQLKNTIAALYSSRPGGTKLFTKDGVEFGWQPIIDQLMSKIRKELSRT